MELNPNTKSILADFKDLGHSDRRQAITAILQNLTINELRAAKDHLDPLKFQKDIWGSLPPELRDIVAKDLGLSDLFALRRVCKLWNQQLSSPALLRIAYSNATAPGHHVLDNVSDEHLMKMIKRRVRAEQERPVTMASISTSPIANKDKEQMSYAHGMFAWIDLKSDETSICLVHLNTGEQSHFTTENRERLRAIRVSDTLIAAISMRGFCHVWEIETGIHKSFRLTSLHFHHFLVHGVKVMVSYDDNIIHFCFANFIARTFAVEGLICSISLHNSEDQVTLSVTCIRDKKHFNPFMNGTDYHLRVDRYTIDEGSFANTFSRYEELPFQDNRYQLPELKETVQVSQGQISLRLYPYEEILHPCLYLSITDDDQVAVHAILARREHFNFMDIAWFDQGLAFCALLEVDRSNCAAIGYKRLIDPSPSETLSYQVYLGQRLSILSGRRTLNGIWAGDGFFLYASADQIRVWSFDEDWEPSGALSCSSADFLASLRRSARSQQGLVTGF
ncbi:uncharacterized protein N7511_009673 [Penicillium nucicola]|uniref:uncharacterized protein n=1 Tax=Penicillium nucicola TaxID=1850975 RepID=UPI002544DDF0|nr:uncharacterized protein N7511_009673 [Penicillium nucicola]KAJ5747977.1 hypothetical protein N7511_009673 [Penicillium nucicola]